MCSHCYKKSHYKMPTKPRALVISKRNLHSLPRAFQTNNHECNSCVLKQSVVAGYAYIAPYKAFLTRTNIVIFLISQHKHTL